MRRTALGAKYVVTWRKIVSASTFLWLAFACLSCSVPVREIRIDGNVEQVLTTQTTLGIRTLRVLNAVYVWDWSALDNPPQLVMVDDASARVALMEDGRVLIRMLSTSDPLHPLILKDFSRGVEYGRWVFEKDWIGEYLRSSRDGKYAAILLTHGGFSYDKARLGIVRSSGGEIVWITAFDDLHTSSGIKNRGIDTIAVSDDGAAVATVGTAQKGSLWMVMTSATDKKVLWEKTVETIGYCNCAAFSPDGKVLYVGGGDREVYGFDAATGDLVSHFATGEKKTVRHAQYPELTIDYHTGREIFEIATSPDGRLVAAGTAPEGKVYVWDTRTGKEVVVLETGLHTIRGLAFSPDSSLLVTGGVKYGLIRVWAMPKPEPASGG